MRCRMPALTHKHLIHPSVHQRQNTNRTIDVIYGPITIMKSESSVYATLHPPTPKSLLLYKHNYYEYEMNLIYIIPIKFTIDTI